MFAYVGSFTTAHCKARGKGISVYRIDDASNAWSLIEVFETLADPGFVALDPAGKMLHVANENSDTIVAFRLDAESGKPLPTGAIIPTGSPSCIAISK